MGNIIKNTFKVFSRDKEFFSNVIMEPIAMLLIFSFFLAFQNSVQIGVINNDTGSAGQEIVEMLDDISYLKIMNIKNEDNIDREIASDSIKLAVVIGENVSQQAAAGQATDIRVISGTGSDSLNDYIISLINLRMQVYTGGSAEAEISLNKLKDTGIPINNSLGVLIFKMITMGSMLGGLLINQRKNGIADRIKMSGTSMASYLGGSGIVFFLCSATASLAYFIAAVIFNFNFGIEHKVDFLVIMLSVNLLATCLSMFISSVVKDDGILWNINVMIILPTSILAGAFFDYNSMPKPLQAIGSVFPQRWVSQALEKLQSGGTLGDVVVYILGVAAFSVALFVAGCIITNKRLSGEMKNS